MADLFVNDPAPTQGPDGPRDDAPLADRLRPRTLDQVIGQEHLTGPEGAIGRMVSAGRLASMVLWGPPGTGKTSIARLLADAVGMRFVAISAVFSGVADLKKAFAEADKLAAYVGGRDEVTRQDVHEIATRTRQAQAFALADALGDAGIAYDGTVEGLTAVVDGLDQATLDAATAAARSIQAHTAADRIAEQHLLLFEELLFHSP